MSEKMPLEEIAREVAEERYHLALVRCWHHFRHDNNPEFRRAEEQALTDLLAYENHKEELCKVFASGESLRILNFGFQYPLAILEALDQFLCERHVSKGQTMLNKVSIEKEDFFIHRRPLAHAAHARYVRQRGHLQRWLRHHWIIPADVDGYRIHLKPAAFTQASFDRCLEAGVLRVFVTGFADGVAPVWTRAPSGGMTTKGLDNPEIRRLSVRKALKKAMKAGADIVVFPELTLCPVLCDELSLWLEETEEHPFIAVLPGSFHRERAGELHNYAELLSRTGKPVLAHSKMTTSVFDGKPEATATGGMIELLDTAIGLIGIPICLDFCEEDPPLGHLWSDLGVEWLLVPAYGPETSVHAHRRSAQRLLRSHGAVTAVANQNPAGQDRDHGFVCHLDGNESSGGVDDCRGRCISVRLIKKT